MKAKTELLLYMLSWNVEKVFSPTFRNLTESFEGWAYRNGLLDQVHRLEAKGFLERNPEAGRREPFVRLTDAGMAVAMSGRNPEKLWKTKWDGVWRILLFDLPSEEHRLRKKMLRGLRRSGCGCLQGSVWISCRLPNELKPFLQRPDTRPSSLLVLESKTQGKHTDRWMVEDAWNWDEIDRRHEDLLWHLRSLKKVDRAEKLLAWARAELATWKAVVDADPFLPEGLLPDGYDGKRVWEERKQTLREAAELAARLMA